MKNTSEKIFNLKILPLINTFLDKLCYKQHGRFRSGSSQREFYVENGYIKYDCTRFTRIVRYSAIDRIGTQQNSHGNPALIVYLQVSRKREADLIVTFQFIDKFFVILNLPSALQSFRRLVPSSSHSLFSYLAKKKIVTTGTEQRFTYLRSSAARDFARYQCE